MYKGKQDNVGPGNEVALDGFIDMIATILPNTLWTVVSTSSLHSLSDCLRIHVTCSLTRFDCSVLKYATCFERYTTQKFDHKVNE